MTTTESLIERDLITKLEDLKYTYRPDIRDRAGLVKNFREKFQALNRVQLGDAEFERLVEEIITTDVFAAAKILRERNSFTRDDGTPLNYTLVNIKDWCKNTFEVVNQLRLNTDNPDIEKCVFVVDRKDIDRHTREEFNRFQEGCVEGNTHTGALVRRLLSDDYADKVIVTTIQKLGLALDENSKRNKENKKQGHLQGTVGTATPKAHGVHLRRMPPLAIRRQPQGHQGRSGDSSQGRLSSGGRVVRRGLGGREADGSADSKGL
jgi:type I site-specific restriction-modification system R (restriction) subunit